MHTVIRIYSGVAGVGPRCVAKRAEIETLLKRIPGFAGWHLVATPDGIATVTTCETREACEESTRAVAAWQRSAMPDVAAHPPHVVSGESLLTFGPTR